MKAVVKKCKFQLRVFLIVSLNTNINACLNYYKKTCIIISKITYEL